MIELTIPIRTVSALNVREHFGARARRVKKERHATGWALRQAQRPALPCVVTMTRLAPSNGLDTDNLVASMKGCRDSIAEWLGVDDKSPLVDWRCEQRRAKEWGVAVSIVPREAGEAQ